MKTKIFTLSILSVFIVAMFAVFVSAATFAEWSLTTDGVATNVNSDVTAGTFTSNGIVFNSFGTNGANAEDWSLTSSLDTGKYFQVTISPKSGSSLTITNLNFDYSSSIIGPASFELQYSKQSNFGSPTVLVTKTDVSTTELSSSNSGLNIQVNSGEILTLRWFGYNFNANTNEFRVKNLNVLGTVTTTDESFCKNGAINDNDLVLNVDISDIGAGDDDDWTPLDTIQIEVELENNKDLNGDGDLDSVVLELGLFKKGSTKNIAKDMIWISKDDEEVKIGNVNEDDSDKHIFEFRVDPHEVEDADYDLKIKAYPKSDEDITCIDYSDDLTDFGSSDFFARIKVSKESDREKMVVVDEKSYPTVINAFCGETVNLPVDIYNIGDRDFDNQVKVTLINNELGINQEEIIDGDFKEGDKDKVNFNFEVPQDAEGKRTYTLLMTTYYDYDKDDETYDEVSDNTFKAILNVDGNCGESSTETGQVVVNARLESGGKAGEELIVRATVTNAGSNQANYLVNAADYSSWASSASLNPTAFSLNSGESKDVLITLNVKNDVSGEKLFNFEVLSGNTLAARQPVSVLIEPSSSTGGFSFGDLGTNAYLWLFGILNVILVVVIIVVAVRVMKK